MNIRALAVNLAIAAGSSLFALLGLYVAIQMYLGSCRSHDIDPSDRLRHSKLIRAVFVDNDYAALIKVLTKEDEDSFKTVWDFDQGISLSRALFIPTEMFGEEKYLYRPHIEVCYARVWTGARFRSIMFPEDERTSEIVARCNPSRLVCFLTDVNGFKNDDSAYQLPGRTILFLGDSFTEGLGVGQEAAFPQQFADLVRRDGIEARVLNLGVNGYSALEMRWILEHLSPSLSPQIVVMNLFLNDVDVHYLRRNIPDSNYARMFVDLDKALEFSQHHGISLYISIIPAKEQFSWSRDRLVFQRRVRAWAWERGARCLDPYLVLRDAGGKRLYFDWDPHFNEEGHRTYAEFLAGELRAELREGGVVKTPGSSKKREVNEDLVTSE